MRICRHWIWWTLVLLYVCHFDMVDDGNKKTPCSWSWQYSVCTKHGAQRYNGDILQMPNKRVPICTIAFVRHTHTQNEHSRRSRRSMLRWKSMNNFHLHDKHHVMCIRLYFPGFLFIILHCRYYQLFFSDAHKFPKWIFYIWVIFKYFSLNSVNFSCRKKMEIRFKRKNVTNST